MAEERRLKVELWVLGMEMEMGKAMEMGMVMEKEMAMAEEWLLVFQWWVGVMRRDQGSSEERMSQ